jgi:NifU-like protein involved in Fe-S cluster formation
MNDDADIAAVYSNELIALSEKTRAPRRLENPDLRAKAVSPVCGSEVLIELKIENGKIADIGYDIEACALTRAVVAVLMESAKGRTRAEVLTAAKEMRGMLEGGEETPSGAFSGLGILSPVRGYPSRHDSLLLPFEAVERAFARQ